MKPVFQDPQRKRWKRLRLITEPIGITITIAIIIFGVSLFRSETLATLALPDVHRSLKPVKKSQKKAARRKASTHRKTSIPPSEVPLNSDEGIRAAYYVPWDEGSFASLKEFYPQIDLLFPEWIHVVSPDGRLVGLAQGNKLFDIVQNGTVQPIDDRHPVMAFLKDEKAATEVFPLINNFDPVSNKWLDSIGDLLNSPSNRALFRQNVLTFLASDRYRGVSLDLEEIPLSAQPGFKDLIAEMASDLHQRGLKLYVNLPADDNDFDYAYIAAQADGIILMNYDQHVPTSAPGPVASQIWFVQNLQKALQVVPREKVIVGIGNYGYDWPTSKKGASMCGDPVCTVSTQEAWLHATESEAQVSLDPDTLNPHYTYLDENNVQHEVWFLDAVSALNQMRAARRLGINTFALWRLGAEDGSLWNAWDRPQEDDAPQKLASVPPGHDVDLEGRGEILRVEKTPEWGWRNLSVDKDSGLITDESFVRFPGPYTLNEYGGSQNQVAITFDDGPDPRWTPKILDVLKQKNAKATFFLIGGQAEKFPDLMQRIYDEGNEIGNHTWSHPDVSSLGAKVMMLEMNSTERLFEAKLGVKPLFFRPPYAIDEEPDTAEQVEPLLQVQDMGYVTIGSKIDPNDWRLNPRPTAEQMTADIINQMTQLRPGCLQAPCGNVILLHDGGGIRSETVRALPMIIDAVRAHGYQVVPLSQLVGKQRSEVMLPIDASERWSAVLDNFGFDLFRWFNRGIILVFIFGNFLMTSRLLLISALAIFDRFRKPKNPVVESDGELPAVAVLVPSYNEEKVIVRTVRAVLASEYPQEKLRVIVIDDGSADQTSALTQRTFTREIASGRLLLLRQPNGGKAKALNNGLDHMDEEIFVGIDADTVIAPNAIARLVTHFRNPEVAAVAGNAKVGNRVNLWTRWQALEYITSQNFERRALDAIGIVPVVPGALGGWRTAAVREQGGYHTGTVAEDADLTMSLLRDGYRVEYEDRALAFTEAPTNANGLMRQRFRWSFGILQSVWKHIGEFRRKSKLGWIALPNIVIFQILLPLLSPFIDLMFLFGVIGYVLDRHYHPTSSDPTDIERLTAYFVLFLITDFIASVVAFSLERREPGAEEDVWLLSQVWLQRFAYRQLLSLVLFKTLKRAIDGRPFSWDKLERTAAMTAEKASVGTSAD